jgi:hypothetical protein
VCLSFMAQKASWLPRSQMKSIQGRVDVRAAQQAAIGMRMASLKSGAHVEIVNLHARLLQFRFALPKPVPRMAYQLPGAAQRAEPGHPDGPARARPRAGYAGVGRASTDATSDDVQARW